MAYTDIETRISDPALRAQVKTGIRAVAKYILDGGSPNNRNHETHAENATKNPDGYIEYFIHAVAVDSVVAAAYPAQTDVQVQNVLDGAWQRAWK
jgi:hypothetical protein